MKQTAKRILVIGVCVLLQIITTISILLYFSGQYAVIQILNEVLSIIIILAIIKNSKNLSTKIPWIILILMFPILGGTLYIIIGHNLYKSKILKEISKSIEKSKQYLKQEKKVLKEIEEKDLNIYGQVKYISQTAGYPIYKNSKVKYFCSGEEGYKLIIDELKKAKKFIFMEYFIIAEGRMWGEILNILEEKVRQGVDVRIIYDDIGCVGTLPKNYDKYLEKKGIKCVCFNRLKLILSVVMNNRDHRKIMVIDGEVSFSGGINIADEYINEKSRYGYWKDNLVMIKGEATWNFTVMFLEIWNAYRKENNDYKIFRPNFQYEKKDGYVCPYGENPIDNETVGENIYLNIINQAKRYVYIFTPYLIIDNEMISALTLASKRGVDIRIVTPGIPDKKIVFYLTRSYYKMLIDSGVKIYEYTPGFIHGKVFVCDDEIATVGSLNLDYRSLYLHFECGVYMYKTDNIIDIKEDITKAISVSHNIEKEDCISGIFKSLFQAILRIFAPLM